MSLRGRGFTAGSSSHPLDVAWLHVASKALTAAVKLGLFDAVGTGATAAEVAARAKVSERGCRMLLDALCPFGLVRKEGKRYQLGKEARETLVSREPTYIGEQILAFDAQRPLWEELPAVVASGRPLVRLDDEAEARRFFPDLARRLYRTNLPVAERAAQKLVDLRLKPRRILDVAAGSGVWGIAVARRFPKALVTALDLPEILPVARDFVEQAGLASRFAYLEGNLREVDLGEGGYDLVILGHILHTEGAVRSRELLGRVAKALGRGGACLIAEFIPDEARRERLPALLFALNMLMRTSDGDVFTLPELRAWLVEVGLTRVSAFDAGVHSPLVLGRKVGAGKARPPRAAAVPQAGRKRKRS